jgi:DNA-binding transcriptional LysR family regulator
MELKWLADFLSVAETQSFSRSACLRHVTQSALSRRIQQLEQWLGVSLFDRTVSPVRLSPGGEDFLPRARELISLLQTTRDEVGRHLESEDETLSFSMLNTLSLTFFPTWVQSLGASCGGFNLRLSQQHAAFAANVAALTSGESDFLLTYVHPLVPLGIDAEHFSQHCLGYEKVMPVSVPDRHGKPVHAIRREGPPIRFLSYGGASFFGQALRALIAKRPLPLKTVYENPVGAGLKAMALTGAGAAWIPESLMRAELSSGALVLAADASWTLDPEIRLYRAHANTRPIVQRLWAQVSLRAAVARDDMPWMNQAA